jgi:hypothetical protein
VTLDLPTLPGFLLINGNNNQVFRHVRVFITCVCKSVLFYQPKEELG